VREAAKALSLCAVTVGKDFGDKNPNNCALADRVSCNVEEARTVQFAQAMSPFVLSLSHGVCFNQKIAGSTFLTLRIQSAGSCIQSGGVVLAFDDCVITQKVSAAEEILAKPCEGPRVLGGEKAMKRLMSTDYYCAQQNRT